MDTGGISVLPVMTREFMVYPLLWAGEIVLVVLTIRATTMAVGGVRFNVWSKLGETPYVVCEPFS